MRVVITGSSGFIGRHLVRFFAADPAYSLVLPLRAKATATHPLPATTVVIEDMQQTEGWKALLEPNDIVIHLAGMAHKHLASEQAHDVFYAANVAPLEALAIAAKAKAVNQLIFISSIGVYGSSSSNLISVDSTLRPDYPYAVSKLEAEQRLLEIADEQLQVKILRIPLVYGADAPGNFGSLLKLVRSKLPLPFGLAHAKKSFLSVDNLVQIIERLIRLNTSAQSIYVAADPEAVSLQQLIQLLANGMGHQPINLPFPLFLLEGALRLLGKGELYKKMCQPLQVDSSALYQQLNWQPEHSVSELLQRTGAEYVGIKS